MKIYVVTGRDPYDPGTHWIEKLAYTTRIDAEKEAYALEEASKDEDTGYMYYYSVYELEVI